MVGGVNRSLRCDPSAPCALLSPNCRTVILDKLPTLTELSPWVRPFPLPSVTPAP